MIRSTVGFAVVIALQGLMVSTASACEPEHLEVEGETGGTWTISNRSCGTITLTKNSKARDIKLTCQALSMREGDNDKWLSLTIHSPDLTGMQFYDKLGVENATRITTQAMESTVWEDRIARIFIVHQNNKTVALDLSCDVTVKFR